MYRFLNDNISKNFLFYLNIVILLEEGKTNALKNEAWLYSKFVPNL